MKNWERGGFQGLMKQNSVEMLQNQDHTDEKDSVYVDSGLQARQILQEVYHSLLAKGYNPVMQIVGYLTTEDPTYIPNYNRARELISSIDRDELLCEIVRSYFEKG